MIVSPMSSGNGAHVVHKLLEKHLKNYKVASYSPKSTFMPALLFPVGRSSPANLIHTSPDYGCFHKRSNTPLILTFHNYILDQDFLQYGTVMQQLHWKTDLKWFTQLSINQSDMITAVSQATASLAKKDLKIEKEIRVIYNGVDESFFQPTIKKKNLEFRVLFSGNLIKRKGAHWLTSIADYLDKNIVIYYTSGLRENSELVNHPRLKALGKVPYKKMPELYQNMDMLLFPTVREGFSLAVLEAMACALPVVTSNISSLPEQIIHGQGGYLCELGNTKQFAEAINNLAQNAAMVTEMGQFNRAQIEQYFTLQQMINNYKNLFAVYQ